jgi:hypothetical protein
MWPCSFAKSHDFFRISIFVEMFERSLARRMARRPMRPLASWRGSRGQTHKARRECLIVLERGSGGPTHPKVGGSSHGSATAFQQTQPACATFFNPCMMQGAREWARSALTRSAAILDPGRSSRGLPEERAHTLRRSAEKAWRRSPHHALDVFVFGGTLVSLLSAIPICPTSELPCSHWL